MSGRSPVERDAAVLGRELGGGRDLEALERVERALGEGREGAQRLDLDVEELDADRALGGRAEEVEQAAADRELAAVLDLRDALVAHLDERCRALLEIQQPAHLERERVRAKRRVGDLLRQRGRGDHEHRGALAGGERVERRDAQPDEVRRRREVGLVGDAARGVEGHAAGASHARRSAASSPAARSSGATTTVGPGAG